MSKIEDALQLAADPCPSCGEKYNGAYCHTCKYEAPCERSAKLDQFDREESSLSKDFWHALPVQRLQPWIPSNEEIENVKLDIINDVERRLAEDVFGVSHELIVLSPVQYVNISFTLIIPEVPFEHKLEELDGKTMTDFDWRLHELEYEPDEFENLEADLKSLDYKADPDNEPQPSTFEWKLWALDHDVTDECLS